jgi:hypothetical protein
MIQSLTQQRCHNHPLREAAGRCPECRRCYCRECITEHEDRIICATCLKKIVPAAQGKPADLSLVGHVGRCLIGLFLLWVFFYGMGRFLLALPESFHEGKVWQADWWDE